MIKFSNEVNLLNKIIKEWLPVVIIIALIFLARMFVFSPVKVEGHSMDPTLHDKQRLVTSKISNLDRQDIITTKEPDNQNMYVANHRLTWRSCADEKQCTYNQRQRIRRTVS